MSTAKIALRAIAVAILVLAFGPARAQPALPGKITLIVAFAPGGIADTLARMIGQGLGERLHQTIVVENRGGAGGNIAASFVARSTPDGTTLLATTTAIAINETLFANKDYSASDFKTIAIAASSPEALVTGPGNPAGSLTELIKSRRRQDHQFRRARRRHRLAYRGGIFLQIPRQSAGATNSVSGRRAGHQRHDRQSGRPDGDRRSAAAPRRRSPAASSKVSPSPPTSAPRSTPNMPTYAELGFPGFTAASWVGFFAPAKTDPKILATLNATINEIVKTPDVQKKLTDMGFDPITGSQAQADAMFAAEVKKWGDMVKALGLTIK